MGVCYANESGHEESGCMKAYELNSSECAVCHLRF